MMIGPDDPDFPKRIQVIEHDGSEDRHPKGDDKLPDYGGAPVTCRDILIIVAIVLGGWIWLV